MIEYKKYYLTFFFARDIIELRLSKNCRAFCSRSIAVHAFNAYGREIWILWNLLSRIFNDISIKKWAVLWLAAPLHHIYTTIRNGNVKTPRIPGLRSPMRDREEPREVKENERSVSVFSLSLCFFVLLYLSSRFSWSMGWDGLVK